MTRILRPGVRRAIAWWGRRPWPQRLIGMLVCALGLLLLTPTRPAGACGIGDVGCGVDQAMYNAMLITARVLWMLNRLLLLVAYLLDIIRYEIINTLFLGPYAQLVGLVGAAIVPVATLAILVTILAVLLAPITGMPSPFNIRQILVIVLLAPSLLLGLGTALGDLDTLRVNLADQLYAAAVGGGAGFVGGVAADSGDMPAPAFLYPASCPSATGGPGSLLPRHTGGLEGDRVLRPDELAAAYLYASTADIHCDYAAGGELAGLPARWADSAPGYAHADEIGDQEAGDRQLWKDALTNGIIRLFLGLLVSTLALVYYAAHLVFTLALVALWVSIPFGLLFGMFQHDFGWAGAYIRSAFDTLKNSWVTSFIIGLLAAGLIAAAQSGNANVFAGIASGTLVFLVFTFFNALATLKGALISLTSLASGAFGQAAGGANLMGGALHVAGKAALGAASGGAGLALGAAGGVARGAGEAGRMGMVANAAARESGSRAYGLAAALGRSGAGMQVGEFARAVGVLRGPGGDAFLDAMRAGHASQHSLKAFNQRLRGSATTGSMLEQARADAAKLAHADAAARDQRKLERRQGEQLDRLRDGTIVQRGLASARALPGAAARAGAAVRRGAASATADDLLLPTMGALAAGGAALGRTARRGAYRAGAMIRSGQRAMLSTTGRAAQAVRRGADPSDRFAAAWRMDAQGAIRRVEDAASAPPDDARRHAFSTAELRDQLRAGATVRFHPDRTASVWGGQAARPGDAAPADAPTPNASAAGKAAAAEPTAPSPSVADTTLAAMRAQRPARPPRPRPAGSGRTAASPARYFSDTDPVEHFR